MSRVISSTKMNMCDKDCGAKDGIPTGKDTLPPFLGGANQKQPPVKYSTNLNPKVVNTTKAKKT